MNTQKILLDLIKSSIDTQSNVDIDESLLTIERQQKLYYLSKKHDLAHIVSDAFNKTTFKLDDKIYEAFNKEQIVAVYRYERINHEYKEICELFDKNGVDYIPLKGAIIRELYPQPWMRTSCDIDILVKEEQLQKAINLLTSTLNFKKGQLNYHDVSMISPSKVHLELHYSICENIKEIDKLLVKVWDYAKKKESGCEFSLDNEYFMFHIIAHMMYHFVGGGCGIRTVLDLYLIRKKLVFDEQKLFELLEECNIKTFYLQVVNLIEVWFEKKPHNELTKTMEKFILSGGVYGNAINSCAVKKSSGNKKDLIKARIFVSYEVLKNKYPILKKHKWLTPFYQIRRWISSLFKGKIKKVKKEIKNYDSVTDKQVQDVGKMFTELGLNKNEKGKNNES